MNELNQDDGIVYVQPVARERAGVRDRLQRAGVPISVAADLSDLQRLIGHRRAAVCVIDLADRNGAIGAIRVVRAQSPSLGIAAVIDPANPAAATEALEAGANDLLPWPFDDRDVAVMVANARDTTGCDPAGEPGAGPLAHALFVQSPAMRHVMEQVRDAALTRGGVIVCGEAGTGRELTARAIHAAGGRRPTDGFVVVPCDADTTPGLEQLLFGVLTDRKESPARSGVEHITRDSALWQAQHGTLLLMNVAEAPARVQMRLARLLRDREAWLVEERAAVDMDVRPIAACDAGIDATVADGRLRRDLFDRLATTRIDVPPLRRRREDVSLLAAHFLGQACAREGVAPRRFSRSALSVLAALPWHGNAKELLTLIETLVRSSKRPVIQLDDVLEHARLEGGPMPIEAGVSLKEARARFERDCISAVLLRHHGRMGEAAKALGIQRTNLYRKVRQLKVARALVGGRR